MLASEKERIVSTLKWLLAKAVETKNTGNDWRWVFQYDFPKDIFEISKYGDYNFTEKVLDALWARFKDGNGWDCRKEKVKNSQHYYHALQIVNETIELMKTVKNSPNLKNNPEWAAIRGHEIDDYLINGCSLYQRPMTLKFLRPPTTNTPWLKNLISLQMLGGVATWDEIKGMSGDPIGAWGGDRLRSILHGGFIEIVKKGKYGKRIFGLTEKGEKAIDYAVSH